jgi:hypothetical protein
VLGEADLTSTAKVPTPERAEGANLASAASMFSALGQQPKRAPVDARTAIADDADDLLDAASSPSEGEAKTDSGGDEASPFSFGKDVEQDETAGVPVLSDDGSDFGDLGSATEPKGGKKSGTGMSGRHKKAGTSSRTAKGPGAKGKSSSRMTSRRKTSGKDSGRLILIGSMISLLIMGGVFGWIVYHRQPQRNKVVVGVDETDIKEMVKSTNKQAISALQGQDLAALESALAAIHATANRIDEFEAAAAKNNQGEDHVAYFLKQLKWADVYMLNKDLRDRIQILKSQARK